MGEVLVSYAVFLTVAVFTLALLSVWEAYDPPRIEVSHPPRLPPDPPLVSIVIPARNEEQNIGRCLQSLREQEYTNFEVIVLNDRSTDGTAAVVDAIAAQDPRIRRVEGEKLKPGWLGKSHAIHQGVRHARGDWLLFVDADTWHHPRSLAGCMERVLGEGVDMLSLYPHFECKSFWEKVLQPAVGRMILIAAPMVFVNSPYRIFRIWAMAIGHFILIRRSVYEAVGGHEGIRGRVAEDVDLAKVVKWSGYNLRFLYGFDILSTRMYQTFTEIWRGWSRSFFPAMGNHAGFVLPQVVLVFLFGTAPYLILPFAALALLLGCQSPAAETLFQLGLVQYGILFLSTYLVRAKLNEYPELFYTCPVGGLTVQWMMIHSLFTYAFRREIRWKDRNLHA